MTPINLLYNPGTIMVVGALCLTYRAHRRDVDRYYQECPSPVAPPPSNLFLHIARFFMYSAAIALPLILIEGFLTGTFCGIPLNRVLPHF